MAILCVILVLPVAILTLAAWFHEWNYYRLNPDAKPGDHIDWEP